MSMVSETTEWPWLRKYPPDVEWAGEVAKEPVTAALDRAVARFGNRPAVEFLGKSYSYTEIGHLVDRTARGLSELGVRKGTRVGLFLPNSPYYVICFHAIVKLGAVVVNFNPLYAEQEVCHQIDDSGTTVMVTMDLRLLLPKIAAALEETGLERVIVCSMAAALPTSKAILFNMFKRKDLAQVPKSDAYVSFERLTDNNGQFDAPEIDPDEDLAVLQYTGGTTGVPKGAMLTHANLSANRSQVIGWCPDLVPGEEVVMGVLPLFHVFAMTVVMNLAIGLGATMVLLPRFEILQVLRTLARRRPTLFPGVPTLFNALNQHPGTAKYDLSSLRFCISGGASLPLEVKHSFEEITGCTLVEGYGLSETSPVATCNPANGVNKEGSIGLPLQQTIIEIRDQNDPERLLSTGERGEICIRGPQVMKGYWNKSEETAITLRDGCLHTGDVGYMDEDGYTFLVDRLKDVIITNGYKVYPRVIEEAIYAHEAVVEVTVIGIPDEQRGQVAKAFVRLKDGVTITTDELKEFVKDDLSPLEIPKEIEFRKELPKTMIGKLSKKELVAEEIAKRENSGLPQ